MKILYHALNRRQVHETTKNIESSRSHAIFKIQLYMKSQLTQKEFQSKIFSYLGGSKYNQQNIRLQK